MKEKEPRSRVPCKLCGTGINSSMVHKREGTTLCNMCWKFYFKQRPSQDEISTMLEKAKANGVSRQRIDQIGNPDKYLCRMITNLAVVSGKLLRPTQCTECNRPCIPHAHHRDYDNPLDVEWLCSSCHRKVHAGPRSLVKCTVCGNDCGKSDNKRGNKKRGLCNKHYARFIKYGDPLRVRIRSTCKCGQTVTVRGRCRKCAYREDSTFRSGILASAKKYRDKKKQTQTAPTTGN